MRDPILFLKCCCSLRPSFKVNHVLALWHDKVRLNGLSGLDKIGLITDFLGDCIID